MNRLGASMPVHADTYSTSSSTLVNNEAEDGAGKHMRGGKAIAADQPSRLPIRRSRLTLLHRDDEAVQARVSSPNLQASPRMAEPSASTPVRPQTRLRRSGKPRIQFPDDHRCSEYETDGGPCPCVLDAESSEASSGGSVPSTSAVRLEDTAPARRLPLANGDVNGASHDADGDDEADYYRRVVTARRKKLRQESSVVATPQAPGAFPRRQPAQTTGRLASQTLAATQDQRAGSHFDIARHTQSSPLRRTAHSTEEIGNVSDGRGRSSPCASTAPQAQVARSSPAQSAARKSISNVFERLLREEEQRREEDRKKKEAARLRRQEEKRRRDDESSLISSNGGQAASDSISTGTLKQSSLSTPGPIQEEQKIARSQALSSSTMRASAFAEQTQAARPGPAQKHLMESPISLRRLAASNGELEQHSEERDTAIAPPTGQSSVKKQVSFASPSAESRQPAAIRETPSPATAHHSRSLISPFFPGRYKSPSVSRPFSSANSLKAETEDVKLGIEAARSGLPRASTPPLASKQELPQALDGEDIDIGDDSVRLTVHDLMSALRRAKEEPREPLSPGKATASPSRGQGNAPSQALTLHDAGIYEEDEVYQARLSSVRSRLTQLARQINLDEPIAELSLQEEPRRRVSWRMAAALLGLQLAFAYLMVLAAQSHAEQLFITVHRDMWGSAAGRSALLPRTSPTALFGSVLLRFGLLPDLFAVSEQHRNLMSAIAGKSWSAVSRLAFAALQQPHERSTAFRLLCAKLVASLGIDEGDVVVLGHRVPT